MLRALRMRKGLNFGKWFVIWQKVLKTAIIKESWKCVFPKLVETARIQRLQHIKTFKKRLFSLQKKKKQLNSGAFFQMLCFSPDLERVSKVTVATGHYRLRYWNYKSWNLAKKYRPAASCNWALPLAVLKQLCQEDTSISFRPVATGHYRLRYWNGDNQLEEITVYRCNWALPLAVLKLCRYPWNLHDRQLQLGITACGIETRYK